MSCECTAECWVPLKKHLTMICINMHTHTHSISDTNGMTNEISVVVGRVTAVNITLQYRNSGMQPAFGTTLSFNQQLTVFSQYRLRVDGVSSMYMTKYVMPSITQFSGSSTKYFSTYQEELTKLKKIQPAS